MNDTHPLPHPLIISFVSGKGGVGKTMLAVACAKELSLNNRTLIIDLDFFNRGLTGLLGEGTRQCAEIDKPDFLTGEQTSDSETWKIVQVSKNLFHIYYPDLSQDDMQKFETLNVEVLKESLRHFVKEAAEKCECDCVVIDCHGGPDNSSFAACLISEHTLLVSEPDRITFYGTLNFLRQLKKAGATQDVDLRLVFNKVVPAFSGLFLTGFYNRLIRSEFSDRPLLGIFPLEVYLTKEFEKTPFLTSVYPYSWLAKKTRLMLYDLLSANHKDLLAPVIRSMPRWMRAYRRLSLGKTFPLLNISVIMPTIVTVGVVLMLFAIAFDAFFLRDRDRLMTNINAIRVLQCVSKDPYLAADSERVEHYLDSPYYDEHNIYERQLIDFQACRHPSGRSIYEEDRGALLDRAEVLSHLDPTSVPDQYRERFNAERERLINQSKLFLTLEKVSETIEPYFVFLGYLAVLWLILALLFTWTGELDKRFTYYFRLHRYPSMLVFAFTAPALWFSPLLIIAALLEPIGALLLRRQKASLFGSSLQPGVLLGLGAVMFGIVLAGQIYRVYRDVRYEHHYLEDLFRVVFLVYLVAMPYVLYREFIRR